MTASHFPQGYEPEFSEDDQYDDDVPVQQQNDLGHWLVVGLVFWGLVFGAEALFSGMQTNVVDWAEVTLIVGLPTGWALYAVGAALDTVTDFLDSFRPRR